jgi:hypothetical protein
LRLIFAQNVGYSGDMAKPISTSEAAPASAGRAVYYLLKSFALLGMLLLLPMAVQANWLSKIAGVAEQSGARTARAGSRALDKTVAHLKKLPDRADGAVLAAEATQEGHWRFVNKAGETFTAGTPDELKRVTSVLLPESKPDSKLFLYVTQDTAFQNRGALKELPKTAELSLVVGDEAYRVLKRAEGAADRLFAEVRPGLLIELTERTSFDEGLYQLMRPLDRTSVRVLALEPGGPSTLTGAPRIDPASKRAIVDTIDPASLAAAMGSIRGQTVLITARVDGPLLYVKPSSGPEKSVLVKDLLAAAADADVNLMVLQSASTPRQPGGRNWLWQKVEVKGLDEGLQRPRLADFLNALAGPGNRFAVTATPTGAARTVLDLRPAPDLPGKPAIKPIGDMFSDLVADIAGRVLTSQVQANVRSAERQQELDQRLIPGIPSGIQIAYFGLMCLSLLGLPVARGWWHRIWPPEQAGEYAVRSGYLAARVVRGAAFLLIFLPLTAPVAAPVHMVTGVWQTVTAPLRWWRWLTTRRAPPGRPNAASPRARFGA